MNNLETYDPRMAKKLERRAIAKKDKVASYELWLWNNYDPPHCETCPTIENAHQKWLKAKQDGWIRWELQQINKTVIKKGVF